MSGISELDDYQQSVGQALATNRTWNSSHPRYAAFGTQVYETLKEIAHRDAVRRATAQKVVVTQALDSEQANQLSNIYPEFNVQSLPMNSSVNSFWVASRTLANELLVSSLDRYADTKLLLGGSTFNAVVRRDKSVHIEHSAECPVDVHAAYADAVDTVRTGRDYATMAKTTGLVIEKKEFTAYTRGEAYSTCTEIDKCTHQVDGICADISMYCMSPAQLAVTMVQHGAEISNGFFIYHPDMLLNERGRIPGTQVGFEKTTNSIQFKYPGGRQGVAYYPLSVWGSWLTSHCFTVGTGDKNWFQLELLQNRGWFMFFRLTKIDYPCKVAITHALDMGDVKDSTLVKSWSLKDITSDPELPHSWESRNFLVPTRVVTRVKEFAMTLPQKDFNRYNIRKQISVVNNRWVLSGTSVTVHAALDPRVVEDLTVAIYTSAFIDRYDSSQLSAELMKSLALVAKFHDFSPMVRISAVYRAIVDDLIYERMGLNMLDKGLRRFMDRVIHWLKPRGDLKLPVSFSPAPSYMKFSSYMSEWRMRYGDDTEFYSYPMREDGFLVIPGAPAVSLSRLVTRKVVEKFGSIPANSVAIAKSVVDIVNTRVTEMSTTLQQEFIDGVKRLNMVDQAKTSRHSLEFETSLRQEQLYRDFGCHDDPDPVGTLSDAYNEILPEVARNDIEFDTYSLSLDPQDRLLISSHLRMNKYFGLPPAPREYYRSKISALNIPKRQNTSQELLTAVAKRNLDVPIVCEPQHQGNMIRDIWSTFLREWCVEDAPFKLARFHSDPVALEEGALADWASKCKPEMIPQLIKEMNDLGLALDDKPVSEYLCMIKADLKPTLSEAPVNNITAPQVIVHHDKLLNALASSMMRVLVRRLLSLLKPNIHINLLKDSKDMTEFIQGRHIFGKPHKYLENDFSKFDKSQSEFAFALEEYVFRQLGLNEEMLSKWVDGHVNCSIRSLATGMSLRVMYQRKSGDATTAFGNVLLNALSVCYAYRGTSVQWALLMGDDSLICTDEVIAIHDAVRVMAEVFNLSAKNYITDAPYFASNFVVIDDANETVRMVPDPLKRIERLSMHVSAADPQWQERFTSYRDSLAPYRRMEATTGLAKNVTQRYNMSEGAVRACARALATISHDKRKFRSLWEQTPTKMLG